MTNILSASTRAGVALLALLSLPVLLSAQAEKPIKEARPGLMAQASVTPDSARAVALRAVPGAAIREAELEEEHGLLIYSFDLKVAGKSGVEEVQVNAKTGKLVCSEHESAADERAEAKHEKGDSTHAKAMKAKACGY